MKKFIILALFALAAYAGLSKEQAAQYEKLKRAKDYAGLISMLTPLANEGDTEAVLKLGFTYESMKDYKNAIKWYKQNAKRDEISSILNLGILSERMYDYKSALGYFQKAANLGDGEGARLVGLYLAQGLASVGGIVLIDDHKKAGEYFKLAYDKGDIRAGFYLGLWSLTDYFGNQADVQGGLALIMQAARNGDNEAISWCQNNGVKF